MADEEERIRRFLREEFQLGLNLVSRTRNLIRSAASSSVNDLNNAFASRTEGRSSTKKTKQEKTKHVQSITKTVWLLERPDDDVQTTDDGCYGDYALTDDSVLVICWHFLI